VLAACALCCQSQPDGNLLLYDSNSTATGRYKWSTYTSVPGSVMRVNDDATFGVYDGTNNTCYWTSASELSSGLVFAAPYRLVSALQQYELALQIDGNLVINDLRRQQPVTVWATDTQLQNASLPVFLTLSVKGTLHYTILYYTVQYFTVYFSTC
jgi:hypothetical protein